MADYTQMNQEQLAQAADPFNRIVNRDYPILGYTPTDEQVVAARAELDQINSMCRALNATNPQHVGAMGMEARGLPAEEVRLLIDHRLKKREAE